MKMLLTGHRMEIDAFLNYFKSQLCFKIEKEKQEFQKSDTTTTIEFSVALLKPTVRKTAKVVLKLENGQEVKIDLFDPVVFKTDDSVTLVRGKHYDIFS